MSNKTVFALIAVMLMIGCTMQLCSGAPKTGSGTKYFSFNLSKQMLKNSTTQSHRLSTDLNVVNDRAALTPLVASARQLLSQFLSAVDTPAVLDSLSQTDSTTGNANGATDVTPDAAAATNSENSA